VGASKEEIRTTDVNYPVISPYSSQCHDPPHLQALASDNSLSRLVLSKKHTQNYINYNYQNQKKKKKKEATKPARQKTEMLANDLNTCV
jgi:hypothetical protein